MRFKYHVERFFYGSYNLTINKLNKFFCDICIYVYIYIYIYIYKIIQNEMHKFLFLIGIIYDDDSNDKFIFLDRLI